MSMSVKGLFISGPPVAGVEIIAPSLEHQGDSQTLNASAAPHQKLDEGPDPESVAPLFLRTLRR